MRIFINGFYFAYFTLLFLLVRFVRVTNYPVATVTTAVTFHAADVMWWRR
jgi:hypothetical protein